MGDVLTQGEIDALLTMSEPVQRLHKLLSKKGLGRQQIAALLKSVAGLDWQAMSRADLAAAAIAQARALLGEAQLSDAETVQLQRGFHDMIGDMMAQRAGQQEAGNEPQGEAASQRVVSNYDFRHPARVNRDQLRTLENLHDNFARLLSSTFSGAMRAVVDVNTAFVDQTTYREFIMSLSNPSCSYQFTLGPTGGQAILDIAMPLVFASVDRIFGGKGSSAGVDARQMSMIEMGVIAKILKRIVEDLEATWEPIQRVDISDIELETNPEFMQITAASEIVILLAFEVNATNACGLVSLCYPFYTLEPILPRLGQQGYVRRSRRSQEETIRRSRAALGPVRVPLSVELGRTRLRLADVDGLKVGDVVCCDRSTTDPLTLRAGGRPKFYVRPFRTDTGRLAVKGVGRIPEALQDEIDD